MITKRLALRCVFVSFLMTLNVQAAQKLPTMNTDEKLIAQIDSSSTVEGSFVVIPDSKRVAYIAEAGSRKSVVLDGKEEKQYDTVAGLIFSPNSKRVAYWAMTGTGGTEIEYRETGPGVTYPQVSGTKRFAVVDGKEGKQYDYVVQITFSPDSTCVAYAAITVSKWSPLPRLPGMPDVTVNNKPLVAPARGSIRTFVVVNGREEKQYLDLLGAPPIFNQDGSLHYLARTANAIYLVRTNWIQGSSISK